LFNFSAKNLLINSHQAHQIAAHPFHHPPMGLPDDHPSSFGDHSGFGRHYGLDGLSSCWQDMICCFLSNFSAKNLLINSHQAHQIAAHPFHQPQWVCQMIIQAHLEIIVALGVILGWMDDQAVGNICHFLSNFSAKNLLINSHQAHQITAHPFHHLPMGLPDDHPSSFEDHCGFGRHSGLDGRSSCWQDTICHFLSNFSAKNLLMNSHQAHQITAHPFHHLPRWVCQMIIQAHLEIIVALVFMLGWMDYRKLLAIFAASCPTFQPKTS
jgi:hypothetical protein